MFHIELLTAFALGIVASRFFYSERKPKKEIRYHEDDFDIEGDSFEVSVDIPGIQPNERDGNRYTTYYRILKR